MAKGRPKSGVPYMTKAGGNLRAYIPELKSTIDLGTTDEAAAHTKIASLRSGAPPSFIPKAQAAPVATPAVPSHPMQPVVSVSSEAGNSAVDSWLQHQMKVTADEAPAQTELFNDRVLPFPKPSESVQPPTQRQDVYSAPIVPISSRKSKGLTPEQIEKMGKGLEKCLVKVNIVAAEACVRYLGRDPYPLEDDEIELLSVGWQMMMGEYFQKNKPEPWMVLLAGNVAIVFAMYMRGEKTVKKPSVEAPGHAS